MAGFPPDIFYLAQRIEILTVENRQLSNSITALVQQEGHLRQTVEDGRRQLLQKEAEKRGLEEDVERLRAQLLETEQQLQERRRDTDDQPKRKKARAFESPEPLNNGKPWSTLTKKSIKHKRLRLRRGYLEPCFSTLPKNIVRADVSM